MSRRDGLAVSVGIEFVVSVLLGLGIGYWLDKKFGLSPGFTIGGLLFGATAGFRSLYIALQAMERGNRADEYPRQHHDEGDGRG